MIQFYYFLAYSINGWLCPVIDALNGVELTAYDASAFAGVIVVRDWLSLFNDAAVWPAFFTATLGVFVVSLVVNYVLRLVLFVKALLPFV